ncbi:DUF4006 domain-containing protein [Helicobacter anseris]|uniref:DUF4006 domain-containing protein n=1 Tax=Helicobacter anseris TaxID=375926 RepID=A0A3D8JB81_9HELI|nr:DUF4006 family protein [Helicobacter anseris]RDU74570.1 DUF4006 domain-containing protein [Helicobacter anseris]
MNKLFGLNGLFGFLIAVVLVVGLAISLGYVSVLVQQKESTNHYSIDRSAVEMKDTKNTQYYKLIKE